MAAERELRVDLLVLGGGMGGLAAAARASELGAVAGVVEKQATLGGSAALSAGMLWAPRSYDELRERIPDGDARLGRAYVDGFAEAAEALLATGVERSAPIDGTYFGFGAGWQIDVRGLFDRWQARIEGAGGFVVRETSARQLLRDGDAVVGARLRGRDGESEVRARGVLVATGGFQGDPELVAAFIGPHADSLLVRSNPGSVGDGFRLATAAGASASRSLGGFYGHLLPSPLPGFEARHYLPLTQYHSIHSIVVNRRGRRFADESLGDEITNQELLFQPDRRAVLLCDEAVRRRYVVTEPYPGGEVADRFADAASAGARYATAPTVEALVDAVASWGVSAGPLRETLDAAPDRLVEPPFHALEVQPAITFPHGGIRVDADGRALDRDGLPVPGLYAAGADAGGVFHVGYGGGLAWALVSGRRAASAALT
jgi:succinate dehydrogenase/fumarate reductase flavoprotein subunit